MRALPPAAIGWTRYPPPSAWQNRSMFTTDELKASKLCCVLNEAELTRFAELAADVRLAPGEWLIREGEPPWFYVLFEGKLRMVKDILGRQQDMFEYEYAIGDFFGETPILLGAQALVSLRAETSCRVARLERQELQNLIRDSKEASAMILQTMNDRIMRAQKYATTVPSSRVLILGTKYDTDCRDIRGFLAANRIPFEFVDRELEPERVPSFIPKDCGCPAVAIDGKLFDHAPSVRELAEALQLQTKPNSDSYDLVIVGAGPAGVAAGGCGASEGLKVLLVERSAAGGQAGTSSRIENYLGFPEGISGEDLTGRAVKQAVRFGAELAMKRCMEKVRP